MKYEFNVLDKPLIDKILQINNVSTDSLNIDNFFIDKDIRVVNDFKDKIIEYKDLRFLIVGDYDCDGICATTIIKRLLDHLNINNNYYIPSRSKQGYGINNTIIDNAYNNHFDVLLMVDNGITALEQIAYANSLGLKVLIIDHHEYIEMPSCEACLHSNMFSTKYSDMCAGGISGLLSTYFYDDEYSIVLAGLATLADMVNVFNFNRYLIKQCISNLPKYDPLALLLSKEECNCNSLSFNVIPKINAVSRMDDLMNVNYLVKFLLSDLKQAIKYYDIIENINNSRKALSKQMYNQALGLIDNSLDIIIVASSDFKEGLCGLLANRIMNEFGKPCLVFSYVDGQYKGSGRSMMGCNIYEQLKKFEDLYINFGGHAQAVGLTIAEDKYEVFINKLNSLHIEIDEPCKQVILVDAKDVNADMVKTIDDYRPYGTNFIEPLLAFKDLKYAKKIVVANKYPKFIINDNLSAISFNQNNINKEFEYMIGRLKFDDYFKGKLSFVIEDLV